MSTVKTTYDDQAHAGAPIARDEARGLLGQLLSRLASPRWARTSAAI
jgi:hypothetical protein